MRMTGLLSLLVLVSVADHVRAQRPRARGPGSGAVWEHLAKTYDKDADGRITTQEYSRGELAFANLDRDGDGVLTAADFSVRQQPGSRARGRRATPAQDAAPKLPQVGDVAPDFALPRADHATGKPIAADVRKDDAQPPAGATTSRVPPAPETAAAQLVRLSDFAGKKPVALVFGSYT